MSSTQDTKFRITERFAQLPKVVQDSILSADVEKHMRDLAAQHQLHFDQWTALENEVMFALLGMQPIEALSGNIEKQVGVSREIADAIAEDISRIVFAPIRSELQHMLSDRDRSASGAQVPGYAATQNAPAAAPVGTPPAPAPEGKAVRSQISAEYVAGQQSHERQGAEGDPYREAVS